MDKIGIAIWGLGNHALTKIIPVLPLLEQFSLIGVCSRNETNVKEVSKQLKCKGWTDSKDMLNNSDVDVIYISTPIGIHFETSLQSLKAGKHVWCEKPLTCNYEDTAKLIHLARKKKKKI